MFVSNQITYDTETLEWIYLCPKCNSKISSVSKHYIEKIIGHPCIDCKRIGKYKLLGIETIVDKSLNGLFRRKCPRCKDTMEFTSSFRALNSAKNNVVCLNCKAELKYNLVYNRTSKLWYRKCPKCKRNTEHGTKYQAAKATTAQQLCKSCINNDDSIFIPDGVRFNINEGKWGIWYSRCPECKKERSRQCKSVAIEASKKMCRVCLNKTLNGRSNMSNEGRKTLSEKAKKRWSDEKFRNKLNNHISYIKNTFVSNTTKNKRRAYNPKVCEYLDKINETTSPNNIFFRHQKNNKKGEFSCLCYFADGYDEKNNIWFEYDEPHHEYPSIKKKDNIRENRIIGKLKCRFIRYSEKYNKLYEIHVSKDNLGNITKSSTPVSI